MMSPEISNQSLPGKKKQVFGRLLLGRKRQLSRSVLVFCVLSTTLWSLRGAPAVYTDNCAACHGSFGQGEGTLGQILSMNNLSLAGKDNPLGLLQKIQASNTLKLQTMVNHFTKKLSNSEMRSIISFIRRFKTLPAGAEVPTSSTLYADSCIHCHGSRGDGSGSFPGLKSNPRDFRDKSIQKLGYAGIKGLVRKSAKKKIKLKSWMPHFPRKFSSSELKQLATFIGGL